MRSPLLLALPLLLASTPLRTAAQAIPTISDDDAHQLAKALRGEKAQLADARWAPVNAVVVAAFASVPERREAARALARGDVPVDVLWGLDQAASAWAENQPAGELDRAALQRGVASPLVARLAVDVGAGECAALGALGRLMSEAGVYGEELDDTFLRLVEASPERVGRCWKELQPFADGLDLKAGDFCGRRDALMKASAGQAALAAFLKQKAAGCD